MNDAFTLLLFVCIVLFCVCIIQTIRLEEMKRELHKEEDLHSMANGLLTKFREANSRLRELLDYKNKAPEECKPGPWCGACYFGKLMMVYSDYDCEDAYYYCTKGECCDYWKDREETE